MQPTEFKQIDANNETAIKLLWGAVISYAVGFFAPQFVVSEVGIYFYTWDVLTPLGLLMIILSVFLTYRAIPSARLFQGVKKFTITGIILALLPLMVLTSIESDVTTSFGYDIINTTFGYYALWLGVILSAIGTFKATSYPSYMFGPMGSPYLKQGIQGQTFGQPHSQKQQPQYQQQTPHYNQTHSNYSNLPTTTLSAKNNFCKNCGHNNELAVYFCVNCGIKF